MSENKQRKKGTGSGEFAIVAAIALSGLGLLLAVPAGAQTCVKWDQPPDPAHPDNLYYGWNESSNWWNLGSTAADDWVCTTIDPVVMIRWWGSFYEWEDTTSSEPSISPPLPLGVLWITFSPAIVPARGATHWIRLVGAAASSNHGSR